MKDKVKLLLQNLEILKRNGIQYPHDNADIDAYIRNVLEIIETQTNSNPIRMEDIKMKHKILNDKYFYCVDDLEKTTDWIMNYHNPDSFSKLKNLFYT